MGTTKMKPEANATDVEIKIAFSAPRACLNAKNASIIYLFSLGSAMKNVRLDTLQKTNRTKYAKNAIRDSAKNVKEIKTTVQHAFLIIIILDMEFVLHNAQETHFLLKRIMLLLANNAIHHVKKDVLVQMKQIALKVIQ